MGYYEGQRARPCPRCGGVVATLFISVGRMSFWQRCGGCGAEDFTAEEDAQLGTAEEDAMVQQPMPQVAAEAKP